MSAFDWVLRSGTVLTPGGLVRADVAIAKGKIVAIGPSIEGGGKEISLKGRYVIPGIIDAHVHFNEPGRAEWEGLSAGSRSLAAGGGTAFFDMPLNSVPPVLDRASFEAKRTLAAEKSLVDFGLWGGLVPENLESLAELKACGVVALKAFMCGSGVDEFHGITDASVLRKGMERAAKLGLLVAVHAEDDAIASALTAEARKRGARDVRSWLATRPVEVELSAIRTAIACARDTGCALHVVHVSSPAGLSLIAEGRAAGVNVTAETCPHYLLLNEEDVVTQGAAAKCCPPLRSEALRREMWARIEQGQVETIGSDHSPAPASMKGAADFFDVWGGVSGCQHGFALTLSEGIDRWGIDSALTRLSPLLSSNVARRFQIAGKGSIDVGFDADLAVLEIGEPEPLSNSDLLYLHNQGPYNGRACRVRVERTYVRGNCVFESGAIAPSAPRGHLIQPNSPNARTLWT